MRWQAARLDPEAVRRSGLVAPAGADDSVLGRASLDNATTLAQRFAAWVADCPGDWLSWLHLARLCEITSAPATEAAARAVALEFLPGETMHWLGVWRLNAGDARGAIAALAKLPAQRHGSMMYLGVDFH